MMCHRYRPAFSSRAASFASATVLLLLALTLADCDHWPCSNDIVYRVISPSGTRVAVHVVRNCGATTDYASLVAITAPGAGVPRDSSVVFSADSGHGAAPSGPNGALDITFRWSDSTHLRITYDSRIRVFRHEAQFEDIHVEYAPKT
jgi:hypothetical protein